MKKEHFEFLYKDVCDWIKFIETKITVLLTFETGLFYFVLKEVVSNRKNCLYYLGVLGSLISLVLLIYTLIPRINKSNNNPFYFMNWADKKFSPNNKINISRCYENQIRDLAIVAKRKSHVMTISIILFLLAIFVTLISGL